MVDKKSHELQLIFGLRRDEIRKLEDAHILNPHKEGQGKPDKYHAEDIERLLDIKVYMIAGYKIADMKSIITVQSDPDKIIDEQIHISKKKIQVLEFIKTIRSDYNKMIDLGYQEASKAMKAYRKKAGLPGYLSDTYWNVIQLVFVVFHLSLNQNIDFSDKENEKFVREWIMDAYKSLEKLFASPGIDIKPAELAKALEELSIQSFDDNEIRTSIKSIVEECISDKDELINYYMSENIEPMLVDLDNKPYIIYRDLCRHLYEFMIEYFIDEQELYCTCTNVLRFVEALDKDALSKGIVKYQI